MEGIGKREEGQLSVRQADIKSPCLNARWRVNWKLGVVWAAAPLPWLLLTVWGGNSSTTPFVEHMHDLAVARLAKHIAQTCTSQTALPRCVDAQPGRAEAPRRGGSTARKRRSTGSARRGPSRSPNCARQKGINVSKLDVFQHLI